MIVEGAVAFRILARHLSGEDVDANHKVAPFKRLADALTEPQTTDADVASLLRHALRYETLRQGNLVSLPSPRRFGDDLAVQFGLLQTEGHEYVASPWRPSWLDRGGKDSVDEVAMLAPRKRFHPDERVAGDPYLKSFGYDRYRSESQRFAIRTALSMPPGKTLIVDLPTGEGKSLVFRAINKVGFASDSSGSRKGLVLVVVPTVTLALDHERSCAGDTESPLAYIGGQKEKHKQIKQRIREGTQGLCFASPEAVVGSLRESLIESAARGGLRAFIVDEAHLVDSWGTGFRTEFQLLAGVRRQLIAKHSPEFTFRTVMLSATLSDAAKITLEDLFGSGETIEVVRGAAVRPEPEYWIADVASEGTRKKSVKEAICQLPKPLILYVTKVDDSNQWYAILKNELGFGRVAKVDGKTKTSTREKVLSEWANGILDVVVATSAFGLGIDYPHVRAVVHACVPESFDRFYQEVGRTGRDGCASLSLIIPSNKDFNVAKSLSAKKVITVKRGHQRWKSMFSHADVLRHGHPDYGIRLDVSPGESTEDIDLIGERSVDWNAQVLSLMSRSKLVTLAGIPPRQDKSPHNGVYQDVRVLDGQHLHIDTWEKKVEPKRQEIAQANNKSYRLLTEFLRKKSCPSLFLQQLYPEIVPDCTSCAQCRLKPSMRLPVSLRGECMFPWPIGPEPAAGLARTFRGQASVLVEYEETKPDRRLRRDITKAIRALDQGGFRTLIGCGQPPEWLLDIVREELVKRPWVDLPIARWDPSHWPVGNRLIIVGAQVDISTAKLRSTFDNSAYVYVNLIMLPKGLRDAEKADCQIVDLTVLRTITMEEWIEGNCIMSILSVLEATPNRVRALTRLVATIGPAPRRDLFRYMVPAPDDKTSQQFNNIVRETKGLRLIEEIESKVLLSPGLKKKDLTSDIWFLEYLQEELLAGTEGGGGNGNFTFAAAWFLNRPLDNALQPSAEYKAIIEKELSGSDVYQLTNASRSGMFAHWCRYLGLAERFNLGNNVTLVADPTDIIARKIPRIFDGSDRLNIDEFIQRMSSLMPIFEGGTVRTAVEKRSVRGRRREKAELSESTSLALFRLEKRKHLELDYRSDANAHILRAFGGKSRSVSHIIRLGAQ